MSWLDNPIANMYGPHFLLLYVAVATVTLSALWYLLRYRDATAGQPPPPLPSEPDPYVVAYLRGGLSEVVRLAVFELLQRGYLVSESGSFEMADDAPELRHLDGIGLAACEWFLNRKGATSAREAFAPGGLAAELRPSFESALRSPLEKERLLASEATRRSRQWLSVGAGGLVLALGVYKLVVALTKGYTNVLFLVLLLIASLVATAVISRKVSHLTARGRKYLDALYLAFNQLGARPESAQDSYLPLLVGLFGVTALAGTAYATYASEVEALQRAVQSGAGASASCGSSCGSSCGGSCGGGCGGGCGGCGG